MLGESSMNNGASLISLIRRASRVQSSSLIRPDRMSANLIFASADNKRMTISDLLISSEKMTLDIRFLIEHDRKKSSPRVELCVGTIDRLARYMWSSLSTSTQRTGTLSIGRTSTISLELERVALALARRSLCAMAFRVRPKTSSSVEKVIVNATEDAAERPFTRFVVVWLR